MTNFKVCLKLKEMISDYKSEMTLIEDKIDKTKIKCL